MSGLAQLAADDPAVRSWLLPALRSHLGSDRTTVAKRAQKVLDGLAEQRSSGGASASP